MILPFEILQKLKCKECSQYLSYGPVYMSDKGHNYCARCSVNEFSRLHHLIPKTHSNQSVGISHASGSGSGSGSREVFEKSLYVNSAYNEVAVLFEFPCKYESYGCMEKIYFTDMKEHEQNCVFRQIECPIDANCKWIGLTNKISLHVSENHPTKLFQRPCILEHDMAQASTQYYLTSVKEDLFVIKVRITPIAPTVDYSLCKIGTIKENMRYRYTLQVESKSENVIREGDINDQSNLTDVDISVAINMPHEGESKQHNIRSTLKIDKFIKCHKCRQIKVAELTEVFDKINFVYYCKRCIASLSPCKNSKSGCIWRGVTGNKFNHENFFCPFTKWCAICNENITECNMLHHLRSNNHNLYKITHLRQKYCKILVNNTDHNVLTINSDNTPYLLICRKPSTFCCKFMLFGQDQNVSKMKCFLCLRNEKSKYMVCYFMKCAFSTSCGQFVWILYVDMKILALFLDKDAFEFHIDIQNTDDE